MRIHFERTGGFTGMPITGTVDVDSLPEEEALVLRELISSSHFFDLPAEPEARSMQGADQFSYKLVVEDEERQYVVETTDASAPDLLRPLLRRLTILARTAQAPAQPPSGEPDSSASEGDMDR